MNSKLMGFCSDIGKIRNGLYRMEIRHTILSEL